MTTPTVPATAPPRKSDATLRQLLWEQVMNISDPDVKKRMLDAFALGDEAILIRDRVLGWLFPTPTIRYRVMADIANTSKSTIVPIADALREKSFDTEVIESAGRTMEKEICNVPYDPKNESMVRCTEPKNHKGRHYGLYVGGSITWVVPLTGELASLPPRAEPTELAGVAVPAPAAVEESGMCKTLCWFNPSYACTLKKGHTEPLHKSGGAHQAPIRWTDKVPLPLVAGLHSTPAPVKTDDGERASIFIGDDPFDPMAYEFEKIVEVFDALDDVQLTWEGIERVLEFVRNKFAEEARRDAEANDAEG